MQTRQVVAIVIVIAILALALGASAEYGQTKTSLTTQTQTVTSYVTLTATRFYSTAIKSELKEVIVQPVETEVSETIQCGANIVGCGTTVSQVNCENLYGGATTETSYVINNTTYGSNPIANTTSTMTIYFDSTTTEVVTTGTCTHL